MTTSYRLHVSELSIKLIDSIKAAFKAKTIEIIVSDVIDETEYLLAAEANRKGLEKSLKEIEEGDLTTMTLEEFRINYSIK